jgi:iron complex outermembrane receptor protein
VGQPDRTYQASANYSVGLFGARLRVTRFGEVTNITTNPVNDQTFHAKFIGDVEVSYRLANLFTLALGVNNVADVYPDENKPANNNSGIFPYSGISPFGFNGRFIYSRLAIGL